MVNPFSKQINKGFLFNIKIDQQVSKNVEKYLLTFFKCGEEKRDVFVSECSSTSEQFIELICKTTITTFASENFERKNKSKVSELQATKGTRDLFGRLLYLSATNSIDLESVFFSNSPRTSMFCILRWNK